MSHIADDGLLAPETQFCALIVAGGASRRMGTNKALLRQSPDGPTLIERVIERVSLAAPRRIYIISDDAPTFEFLRLPVASDDAQGIGPLGGIMGGLRVSCCERNLVAACDMPHIDPAIIKYMAGIEGDYHAIVPRWTDGTGKVRVEPLYAIYARSALAKLWDCVASGQLGLHACLTTLTVRYVEEHEITRFHRPEDTFRNVNSPADWLGFLADSP